MTYPQALQQLQYWLTNNQTSHANHLNFNAYPLSASRSLHPHQPRAWLRHTPYLRAAQILKPMCRVCAVRTHAFYALRQPAPVGINIASVGWVKTQHARVIRNLGLTTQPTNPTNAACPVRPQTRTVFLFFRLPQLSPKAARSNCIFHPVGQKYQNSNQAVWIPFSVVPFSAK